MPKRVEPVPRNAIRCAALQRGVSRISDVKVCASIVSTDSISERVAPRRTRPMKEEEPLSLRIVRLGTPSLADEGLRLGTVRRPPRGVKKEGYARRDYFDVWVPGNPATLERRHPPAPPAVKAAL